MKSDLAGLTGPMDWDNLKTFLVIVREGSLSAAARVLGVTQTTVGRRLQALQERQGIQLLLKTPGGYVLTPAGEEVYEAVEQMEHVALHIERSVAGSDSRLEGVVRLSTMELLATYLIMPGLSRFRQLYPGISIDLHVDMKSVSLNRREADLVLRIERSQENDVVIRKMGEFPVGLYAAPDYLTKHGMPDLAAGSPGHLRIPSRGELARFDEPWFGRLTHKAVTSLATNHIMMRYEAAREGLGLTALPKLDGLWPGLTAIDQAPPLRHEIWLGMHKDMQRAPRIRAVIDHLLDCVRLAQPILGATG